MSTYEPYENLDYSGKAVSPGVLHRLLCYELIPYLSLIDLTDVSNFCQRRLEALREVHAEHGWWKVELGKEAEEVLDDTEKCLMLGVYHPEHNPKKDGVVKKINAIKNIRERCGYGLKESKQVVEAYAHRVENGEASPPEFPTIIGPESEDVPDFKALEDELI